MNQTNNQSELIVAVDVGGTKTLVALADKNKQILASERFETPQNYQDFLTTLASTYKGLVADKTPVLACIALPGLLNRETGEAIAFGNLPWKNISAVSDIESRLNVPVIIENDAKAAALSEAHALETTPTKALYVTVSTGIGAGLVIDGELSPYFEDMEIGHMEIQHEGKLSGWEEIASGKAISERFGKKVGEIEDPQELYYIGRVLALGLNHLIATLTPDVVIIGGGAGAHLDRFKTQLLTELDIMSTDMIKIPPIVAAKDPEGAVINGCIIKAFQSIAKN
jgi:predicted NBD/HSP70 family sugar kinase